MRTHHIYGPNEPWEPGEFCSLLAIGDSWFWYPKNNVLESLTTHPRLKDPYRFIQMYGYNGARLEEYVFGKYAAQIAHELKPNQRQYYSAVLISGAGNDAVKYRLALNKDCRNATTPEDCIDEEAMAAFLCKIGAALDALLYQIYDAFARDGRKPPVILHSYDYPTPDGRGFKLGTLKFSGPWLSKAMDEAKVSTDPTLRHGVSRILIQRVRARFMSFTETGRPVHLVDSCGCLVADDYKKDWDNELHPTRNGFKRIVDKRWMPVLDGLGFAKA